MISTLVASAPGKLMLLGEYGVVEDGVALVAAVDRRAVARFTKRHRRPSDVVSAVVIRCRRDGADTDARLIAVDTAGFTDAARTKLGIGSSAAVAVAVAALARGRVDPTTYALAVEGHRDAAGGIGSGVDVSASFCGGVIAAKRQPGDLERLPPSLAGLHMFVLATGQSASTAQMVERCRVAPTWSEHVSALAALAADGVMAWRSQDAGEWVATVAEFGRRMAALGQDASVPIVTDTIAAIMAAAEAMGGAAKPSGAGGGDVAIAFGADPDLGARIAGQTGTSLVAIAIDPAGVTVA